MAAFTAPVYVIRNQCKNSYQSTDIYGWLVKEGWLTLLTASVMPAQHDRFDLQLFHSIFQTRHDVQVRVRGLERDHMDRLRHES